MSLLEILLLAVGLAMDAFAVSLGASASGLSVGPRAAFRLSFHFGLFQFLMPLAGWLAGAGVAPLVAAVDHWVAFGLLALVGGRMIRSGPEEGGRLQRGDPSRGMMLVMLSLATSIDAFAVGLSLAFLRVSIWYPCLVIGLVTGGLSLVGVRLGRRVGVAFGRWVAVAGGILLILIGLHILVTHLSA